MVSIRPALVKSFFRIFDKACGMYMSSGPNRKESSCAFVHRPLQVAGDLFSPIVRDNMSSPKLCIILIRSGNCAIDDLMESLICVMVSFRMVMALGLRHSDVQWSAESGRSHSGHFCLRSLRVGLEIPLAMFPPCQFFVEKWRV